MGKGHRHNRRAAVRRDKPTVMPRAEAPERSLWPIRAGIAVAAILPFLPALTGEFLNWDDNLNVTQNPLVRSPSLRSLKAIWTEPVQLLYVPVFYTSLMLDWLVGRGSPVMFRATNLLLHGTSAVLVFEVLRRVLSRHRGVAPDVSRLACAVAAVLFAVHPLQVESVAWITGRKDLLAGFFGLLATLFYLDNNARPKSFGPNWWAATFCFVAAVLSKPAAVSLPLAVVALDLFGRATQPRECLVRLLPWLTIGFAITIITTRTQVVPVWLAQVIPTWKRPFVAADALAFYARKLVLPLGHSPVYGRQPQVVMAQPAPYVLFCAAVVTGAILYRLGSLWAASGGFALAMLLPVLGLVPFLFQNVSTVADHYMYLSMAGVALGCAAGLAALLHHGTNRKMVFGLAGVGLLVLGGLSARQSSHWRTSTSLWAHALAVEPTRGIELSHAAMAFRDAGDRVSARKCLERAVALEPGFGDAHAQLGHELLLGKENELAAKSLERAVTLLRPLGVRDERLAGAMNNLVAARVRLGRLDEAQRLGRELVAARPDYWAGRVNFGMALLDGGKLQEAEREFLDALRLKPGDSQTLRLLEEVRTKRRESPSVGRQ